MNICKFCGKEFDPRKQRRKSNAKYCNMACYHADRWGYTGNCHNCGKPAKTKYCTPECQKDYWNKNGYQLGAKGRYWKRKINLIKSLGGKCVICGNNDIRVLDIHHINSEKKKIPKDKMYNWTRRFRDWEANDGNLEILCANCHRIHTWNDRGFGDYQTEAIIENTRP